MENLESVIALASMLASIVFTVISAFGLDEKIKNARLKKLYGVVEAVVQETYNEYVVPTKMLSDSGKLTLEERQAARDRTLNGVRGILNSNYPTISPLFNSISDVEKIEIIERVIRGMKKA